MAILIDESARVISRGLTGSQGAFPSEQTVARDPTFLCDGMTARILREP